jgi:hypothetical protein
MREQQLQLSKYCGGNEKNTCNKRPRSGSTHAMEDEIACVVQEGEGGAECAQVQEDGEREMKRRRRGLGCKTSCVAPEHRQLSVSLPLTSSRCAHLVCGLIKFLLLMRGQLPT